MRSTNLHRSACTKISSFLVGAPAAANPGPSNSFARDLRPDGEPSKLPTTTGDAEESLEAASPRRTGMAALDEDL